MGLGGQRVYKKTSPDNCLCVYVEERDFLSTSDNEKPIKGVVMVNTSLITPLDKIFASVVVSFRFGREEDEILGMTFCREVYLVHEQVYPIKGPTDTKEAELKAELVPDSLPRDIRPGPSQADGKGRKASLLTDELLLPHESSSLTDHAHKAGSKKKSLADRIARKPGEILLPFSFVLPENSPLSVAMQQSAKDSGDSCSVRYSIRCYAAKDEADQPNTTRTVNLAIRKLQHAPLHPPVGLPSATLTKDYPLCPGKLFLEATLDKSLYHHGEDVTVTCLVQNFSNKTVKHIKVNGKCSADDSTRTATIAHSFRE